MKKQKFLRYCVYVIALCLSFTHETAAAKTYLSQPLILPGTSPVQVKFRNAEQSISVSFVRTLTPEIQIPDNAAPARILCPDLTIIEVQPGQPAACPDPKLEKEQIKLLVQVDVPWIYIPPSPEKAGNGTPTSRALTAEEIETLHGAEQQIGQLAVEPGVKQFLLATVYAANEQYDKAIAQAEQAASVSDDPAILRLLGSLYLQSGDFRTAGSYYTRALERSKQLNDLEGQALAHHQLASLYKMLKKLDDAKQHAQQAIDAYQKIGRGEMIPQVQEFLQRLQE